MDSNRSNGFYLFLLLAAGICLGMFFNKTASRLKQEKPSGVLSKFDEVMWYVDKNYVDTIDSQQLEDEAVAAMIEELDPHSIYISQDEFNAVNDPLLGSFEGIGVQFRIEHDTIAIVNVIKGGPSEKVGILAGDRIVTVNDSLVASPKLKNDDVMRLLKGPKGTKVKVGVYRRGI